jgi:hypothetical protein
MGTVHDHMPGRHSLPGVHGRAVEALRAAECLPERRYPGGWAAVFCPMNRDEMDADIVLR